jgi:thiosulfate dehydrogenase
MNWHMVGYGRVAVPLTMAALGAYGCGSAVTVERSAEARGEALFAATETSDSVLNAFSCATCHRSSRGDRAAQVLSGGSLAGATGKTIFWSGGEQDLLSAINHCRFYFMRARDPWQKTDAHALSLFAYLQSRAADEPVAANPTWVTRIDNIGGGAGLDGAQLYTQACGNCHGAKLSGAGGLVSPIGIPPLPKVTLTEHSYLPTDLERRLVFVEKTRHGGFFGYGGVMPPFSRERLTDAQLAAILDYLGVPDPK